jgi:hypothetical protein
MVQFPVNPQRHDPLKPFKFQIWWDGTPASRNAPASSA